MEDSIYQHFIIKSLKSNIETNRFESDLESTRLEGRDVHGHWHDREGPIVPTIPLNGYLPIGVICHIDDLGRCKTKVKYGFQNGWIYSWAKHSCVCAVSLTDNCFFIIWKWNVCDWTGTTIHTLSSMTLRFEQFSKSAIFVSMLTWGTEFYNQSYNVDK